MAAACWCDGTTGVATARKLLDEIPISLQEIKAWQNPRRSPQDLSERAIERALPSNAGSVKCEFHGAREGVVLVARAVQFAADPGLKLQFFAQFAPERGALRFSPADFAAWKLPLHGESICGPALANEESAIALNHRRHHADGLARVLFRPSWRARRHRAANLTGCGARVQCLRSP
jgi:hypothetical protein